MTPVYEQEALRRVTKLRDDSARVTLFYLAAILILVGAYIEAARWVIFSS